MGTLSGVTAVGDTGIPGNDSYHLNKPVHMAFDSNDNMYVSDRVNNRVQFFTRGNLSGTTVAGITGKLYIVYLYSYICILDIFRLIRKWKQSIVSTIWPCI